MNPLLNVNRHFLIICMDSARKYKAVTEQLVMWQSEIL